MTLSGRIAVVRRFGGPDAITIEEHPSPELRSGQFRVAVTASGINPVDARLRSGSFGGSTPMVMGSEYAGVVIESRDAAWRVGDEVIGWGVQGANGDLVVTDSSRVVTKPEGIDFALGSAIGGVGTSALTALESTNVSAGGTIVVHGAAGGVGTLLTQLAVARGIRVIGTASEANHDYLRELGAVPVAYGPGLADRLTAALDGANAAASIDLAGTAEAGDYGIAVRDAGGTAITLVPETAMSHGIPLVRNNRTSAKLRELLSGLTDGTLTLPVERIPFADIVEAHRRIDAKRATGKLSLDHSDNPHMPSGTTTSQEA